MHRDTAREKKKKVVTSARHMSHMMAGFHARVLTCIVNDGLTAPINLPTQFCDPISCLGKPVERNIEVGLNSISLVRSLLSRSD